MAKPRAKQQSRKPKRFPHPGRQSKRELEAWFFAIQSMLHSIIHTWPEKQQVELLDSLVQLFVQRLNLVRERSDRHANKRL